MTYSKLPKQQHALYGMWYDCMPTIQTTHIFNRIGKQHTVITLTYTIFYSRRNHGLSTQTRSTFGVPVSARNRLF